mmetsp:Transcript_46941/g.108508  ORF Transcript_46941/g.108508 Transcript_46941/m.108508 type:complete len:211 (-) Transcript_46941:503-1135(-)
MPVFSGWFAGRHGPIAAVGAIDGRGELAHWRLLYPLLGTAQDFGRCHGSPDLCGWFQRSTPTWCEEWLLQHLCSRRPLVDALVQQPLRDIPELFCVVAIPQRPGRALLHDLACELEQRPRRERQVQSTELEADATQRPHVHVVVVALIPHQLRRHVRRRADNRGGPRCAVKDARDAKVADADASPALAQKDVGALEVAVHHALPVEVLEA